MKLEDPTRSTILVHYYRAMVGRADIWRMRMDTTTNWSIGTTAAVVSFALGNAAAPHYVVHIASFLTVIFLLLEARRLTFYHLWQQRALLIERALIQPAMTGSATPNEAPKVELELLERELVPVLGTTIPSMSLARAASRRLRRVYVYLFAAQLLAWLLKLSIHPEPIDSLAQLIDRGGVGSLPGAALFALATGGVGLAALLAIAKGGVSSANDAAAESS